MKTVPKNAPVHSGRADHVVGDAAGRNPDTGPDADTTNNGADSGWTQGMAPAAAPGAATQPATPPGVAINTHAPEVPPRGRATEIKRAQR